MHGPQVNLHFRGMTSIATGMSVEGTNFGGISGIVYDPATGKFLAVTDDTKNARLYEVAIDLTDRRLDAGDVRITGVRMLADENGVPLGGGLDLESITLGADGRLYIGNEPDLVFGASGALAPASFEGTIRSFAMSGNLSDTLNLPEHFHTGLTDGGRPQIDGMRDNLGFESLTAFEGSLFFATENALMQDGAISTRSAGSEIRIAQYDMATSQVTSEYVYEVEAITEPAPPLQGSEFPVADNGLSDLIALNETTFLALERSFSGAATPPFSGVHGNFTAKLYLVSTAGATDVSSLDNLNDADMPIVQAKKTLLLDFERDLGIDVDNLEGLTVTPDGTLIAISDDNFGTFIPQATQVLAFQLDPIRFDGSRGSDHIDGTWLADDIRAGRGNDQLTGGRGNDLLYGEAGNDWLFGEDGDDRLYGGTGSDRLFGGAGDDLLLGGKGRDTAVFDGERSDFAVFGNHVLDLRDGSVDTLISVESLSFQDCFQWF